MQDEWGEEAVGKVVTQAGCTQEDANTRGTWGMCNKLIGEGSEQGVFYILWTVQDFHQKQMKVTNHNQWLCGQFTTAGAQKVSEKGNMGNTDLRVKKGKDTGDTSQLLQQPSYE